MNLGGGRTSMDEGAVGQAATHMPQPVHSRGSMNGRPSSSTSSASPGYGHAFTQRSQTPPSHSMQRSRSTSAVPMTASLIGITRSAPVGHAGMQGASSQATHGRNVFTSRKGVPADTPAPPSSVRIAPTGQAFTQSPQRVHATRNSSSVRAPGGRWTLGVKRSAVRSMASSAPAAAACFTRLNPMRSRPRFE